MNNWDRVRKYGDGKHENIIQRFSPDSFADGLTVEEAQTINEKFRKNYPLVAEYIDESMDEFDTLYWRLHNAEIEAFVKWQEESDNGDEEFAAIHVAWLLTRG